MSESFSNLDEFGIEVFKKNKSLTSLKEEIQKEVNMEDVKDYFKNNFINIFNIELLEN